MITNLVFKRYNTSVNPPRTELKIVQVEIPELNNGEGWKLETSGEIIVDEVPTRQVGFTRKAPPKLVVPTSAIEKKTSTECTSSDVKYDEIAAGEKFNSGVAGTAKLIRKKDRIWIAYRNKTKDITAPNSIAISDNVKNHFFSSVKEIKGGGEFAFYEGDKYFDYWNSFIDAEYERQRSAVNNNRKTIAQRVAMG